MDCEAHSRQSCWEILYAVYLIVHLTTVCHADIESDATLGQVTNQRMMSQRLHADILHRRFLLTLL